MRQLIRRLFTLSRGICLESSQKMTHWALNLTKAMKDSEQIVIKSDLVVVIRDKYPKAKHHFLVLPYEDIDDIYELKRVHLPLLEELELMGRNTVEVIGGKLSDFKIGYHAKPSMKRLHLHVISDDFISPCLKTKQHWNSFSTDFFIPAEKVREELRKSGRIEKWTDEKIKGLLKRDLQCHKCSFKASNMPDLKQHLLLHRQ